MRIMSAERKWKEIIDKFKDDIIDNWPDEVAANAFHLRGGAYYNLKDGNKAEKDLKKAAELLTEENVKGLALIALGDTYQYLLKNDDLAIEAYRRVYKTAFYKQCQAAISIAGIFQRQNKLDEAVTEMNRIDMKKVQSGYWRIAMLQAWGSVLGGQGKKSEAIAKYNEALNVDGISSGQKSACEKAIRNLQTDGR
jgi:tetratricopeptide (TPR) repeat protein